MKVKKATPVMGKEKAEWEKLEIIVTELQKQLAPNAEVRHNHHVIGKSGRKRKLDVTITEKISAYPVFIVFDCKRHTRTIKMKDVEAFAGQLDDVGASLGVMISDSGFDAGAKAIATQKRIILQTYRKAEATDWNELFGEKAWFFLTNVEIVEVNVTAFERDSTASYDVPFNTLVFNGSKEILNSLPKIFWEIWKAPETRQAIGGMSVEIDSLTIPIFIQMDGEFVEIERFLVQAKLVAKKYPINLQFAGGNILSDFDTKKTVYREVASQGFDWEEIIRTQPGIEISAEDYYEQLKKPGYWGVVTNAKRYLRVKIVNKD